jgi:hypothetical protein
VSRSVERNRGNSKLVAGAGFEPATAPREAHLAPSLGYEDNNNLARILFS